MSDGLEAPSGDRQPITVGDVIRNPVHGETMTFLEVGTNEDNAKLRVEAKVEPQASGPPAHIHPHSAETFEVLSGAMKLREGRQESVLTEGRIHTVSPNTAHNFWNHTGRPAIVLIEWDPGKSMAGFLDRWFQLAREGELNEKGMARPLQIAVLFDAYLESIAIPTIPLAIQKRLFRIFGRLGTKRGYTA